MENGQRVALAGEVVVTAPAAGFELDVGPDGGFGFDPHVVLGADGNGTNDEKGEERVSIFYKAAFYDRSAFMGLIAQCVTCSHSDKAHPYKGRIEVADKPSYEWENAPTGCDREACECPDMLYPDKDNDE